MRIGTWNMEGRWTHSHLEALERMNCGVWLLTEVNDRLSVDFYNLHTGEAEMAAGRRWAAILSRAPLEELPDPHPASAMARVGGLTFCSTILPWRGCGSGFPWVGSGLADKTESVLSDLSHALPDPPLVWGGDWNHALSGREWAGSAAGRGHILALLARRNMHVPTAALPHQLGDLLTIDHIALTSDLKSQSATRVSAEDPEGRQLSDHDAYVVTITRA